MTDLLADRRVLVVEDEMMILMLIEDMLADLGCRAVDTAATVGTALALIEAHAFDAAMLDMNLNGATTFAVADALVTHGVPFVFATGYASPPRRGAYRDHPVLRKPFRNGEFARTMARLVGADRA